MNITKTQVDALNAVVTIAVDKADYAENVKNVLTNYRKTANIPGFRKGAVPMSMIQKQYGRAVQVDEVNKLLQDKLNSFLTEEKIDILGNPMPKMQENIDWDADTLNFEFELGLVPEFEVNLGGANKITRYTVVADDKLLDEQVLRIQKQYGKTTTKNEVAEGDDIKGVFVNEEAGINSEATINTADIRTKTNAKKFIGKKIGDVVTVSTKGLFVDDHKLMDYMSLPHEGIHDLDVEVSFTISAVSNQEPAELNQEFFDRLFGPGAVSSVDELKAKIKEDAEKQFAQQAEQKFLNDVNEHLLDATSFDLPKEFLVRWLMQAGEKELTAEEAAEEYERSERALRHQLIEGKIVRQNDIQVSFDDLKAHAAEMIKAQMAQFGQLDPSEEDVNGIVARVLSNQDEVRRISEELVGRKLLELYTAQVKYKTKEVAYDQFIKEMYGD